MTIPHITSFGSEFQKPTGDTEFNPLTSVGFSAAPQIIIYIYIIHTMLILKKTYQKKKWKITTNTSAFPYIPAWMDWNILDIPLYSYSYPLLWGLLWKWKTALIACHKNVPNNDGIWKQTKPQETQRLMKAGPIYLYSPKISSFIDWASGSGCKSSFSFTVQIK